MFLLGMALATLASCGFSGTVVDPQAAVALRGTVRGGQQPVHGAYIQLYAAGTAGSGSTAHTLLQSPVQSDSNGNFQIPASYQCPSASSQVYILARGGNPGLSAGAENPNLALMAVLGSCSSLSSETSISVNEVTTVGSIWPLSQYMTSPTDLGSATGDAAFATAASSVSEFINIDQGSSPGTPAAQSYFAQNAKLYSLADVLDKCVSSAGGSAGDGSPCGSLFSMATPAGNPPPSDTVSAAMRIAQNPENDVAAIYGMATTPTAFQPALNAAPQDWTLSLTYIVATPSISVPSGTYVGNQEVTISDATAGTRIYYTTDGTIPTTSSPVYSGALSIAVSSTVQAIAVLNGSASAVASSTLTITAATVASRLVFLQQPSNALAGSAISPPVRVAVEDATGKVNSSATNLVTINLTGASGLGGTLKIAAQNGTATFNNLSVSTPAAGYTLTASSPGLLSATSAAFTISTAVAAPISGASAKLVFLQQPSTTLAGATISPAVKVALEDSDGNTLAGNTNAVTLSLVGGTGLSGTLTVAAEDGVSSFSALSITSPGSGYTLLATSPGLTSSASAAFSVSLPRIALSLPASSVSLGSTLSGSIALSAPAPSAGLTIDLTSSSGNDVTVSPSVLAIAAGQSSGSFTVSGIAAGSSSISATATNYTGASVQVSAAAAVINGPTVSTVETLGAIPASQAVNGLGFNVSPGHDWEFQMAAAAGATHARYQCSWVSTENQTTPPANTTASPQFTLQSDCQAGLASAASTGIHSTIVAAYGSPFHPILDVTVPNGAAAGATTLQVQFASGVGGDTFSTMQPFYDTILSSSKAAITTKHSYAGGLVTAVTLTDSSHATLTLASGLSAALPANTTTQYVINEYLYPPPASFSPSDPSVLAYARYAEFLASKISASGVTGEVEIWNEPPWSDDPWDDRYDFYDNQPVPVSPGPQSTYLPNWGFAAALQSQASPVSGVTYNWGGTEKTGFNSMLDPQMLANTGALFKQPNSVVTTESFHPYGNNPEDSLWSQPCLVATISIAPAISKPFSPCNFVGVGPNAAFAVQLTLIQKSLNSAWGIGHNITETGFVGSSGDDQHKARFIMRQFLGYQAAGVTPVQFYRLYDTSTDNFSFVNPIANADGTHSPLPAYTAIAGLMADLGKIQSPPAAAYAASSLPSIVSYRGTYPLDTVSLVGARPGDTANSILFAVWQRSNTSGTWATLTSPVPATVTVQLPAGVHTVTVVNLDTRAAVSYTTSGQEIVFTVADDPVEVLLEP